MDEVETMLGARWDESQTGLWDWEKVEARLAECVGDCLQRYGHGDRLDLYPIAAIA